MSENEHNEFYTSSENDLISSKLFFQSASSPQHKKSSIYKKNFEYFGNDITYDEIDTMKPGDIIGSVSSKDADQLLEEFATLASNLALLKNNFQEWSMSSKHIPVPFYPQKVQSSRYASIQSLCQDSTREWNTNLLYSSYYQTMESFPAELQTVSGVLLSIVKSVTMQEGRRNSQPVHGQGTNFGGSIEELVSLSGGNISVRKSPPDAKSLGVVLANHLDNNNINFHNVAESGSSHGNKKDESALSICGSIALCIECGDDQAFRSLSYRTPGTCRNS